MAASLDDWLVTPSICQTFSLALLGYTDVYVTACNRLLDLLPSASALNLHSTRTQSSIWLAVLFFNRKFKTVYLSFGFPVSFPHIRGFPGSSDSKESACNAGDPGLIPGSGSSPGEGNSNPLQYSCLEKSMDRGAWRATVHGVTKRHVWVTNPSLLLPLIMWPYPNAGKNQEIIKYTVRLLLNVEHLSQIQGDLWLVKISEAHGNGQVT